MVMISVSEESTVLYLSKQLRFVLIFYIETSQEYSFLLLLQNIRFLFEVLITARV